MYCNAARYIYIGSAYVLKFSLNFDKVGDDPLLNHSQGHISKKSCLIDTKIAWFQAVFSIMTNSLTLSLAIWIFKLVHFISMAWPTGPGSTVLSWNLINKQGLSTPEWMKERVSKLTYPTLQHCLRRLYTMTGNSKH